MSELWQTLLQLGAYACILALLGLAARELHADVSGRVLREAANQTARCSDCGASPEPALAAARAEETRTWIDPPSALPLRRSLANAEPSQGPE